MHANSLPYSRHCPPQILPISPREQIKRRKKGKMKTSLSWRVRLYAWQMGFKHHCWKKKPDNIIDYVFNTYSMQQRTLMYVHTYTRTLGRGLFEDNGTLEKLYSTGHPNPIQSIRIWGLKVPTCIASIHVSQFLAGWPHWLLRPWEDFRLASQFVVFRFILLIPLLRSTPYIAYSWDPSFFSAANVLEHYKV